MCDFQTRAMLVARSIRAARLAMAGIQAPPPAEGAVPEGPAPGPLHGFGCACGWPQARGKRPVFAAVAATDGE
ncbi:hypothetical protein [Zavarzinia sp.]|uniref:hypothetical protein n=1 Tax=Zavarzinia sp. TaxID=2027920 RepID=UPI0035657A5E